MSLAKAVANAAAMLVLKAKNVAQVAEDTVLQNRVIAAATQCALSTSQLVACAKVRPERGGQGRVDTIVLASLILPGCGELDGRQWSVGQLLVRSKEPPPCCGGQTSLHRPDALRLLLTSPGCMCFAAGGESHHQLPGVSGAADRSREAGGSLRGELCAGVPGCHG